MWSYVMTFAVSCVFAKMADYFYISKRRKLFVFCSMITLFTGAALAGVRASSVGTDVGVYGNPIFYAAIRTDNVFDFILMYQTIADIEPLYLLLNFLVSRFTIDPHWFYFVLQLCTISFVYLALVEQKRTINIDLSLGVFSYYMLFYAFSLNGMRQALAMSIVLWTMKFVYNGNWKKFITGIILATGFHYTAIICMLIYPAYKYIQISRNKKLSIVTMVAAFCLLAVCNQEIIRLLSRWIPKYSRYLNARSGYMSINPLIVRFPFIFVFCVFYKRYAQRSSNTDFWITFLCADAIFSLLRGILPPLYRMSLYFGMVKIYSYPYITTIFGGNTKRLIKIILEIILFILWYYQVVYQGNDGAYPYISDVFEWLN